MEDQRGDADERARQLHTLEEFVRRVAVPADTVERTRQLDAAAADIFRSFGAARIDALLLKGPALAALLYTRGEVRGYSDIDLLVAPRDLARARARLAELGYEKAGASSGSWTSPASCTRRVGSTAGPAATLSADRAPPVVAGLAGPRVGRLGPPRRAPHRDRAMWPEGARAERGGPGDAPSPARRPTRIVVRPGAARTGTGARAVAVGGMGGGGRGCRGDRRGRRLRRRAAAPTARCRARGGSGPARHGPARLGDQARREPTARNVSSPGAGGQARSAVGARKYSATLCCHRAIGSLGEYPWARRGGARLVLAYVVHLMRAPAWAVRAWRFRRRSRRAPPSSPAHLRVQREALLAQVHAPAGALLPRRHKLLTRAPGLPNRTSGLTSPGASPRTGRPACLAGGRSRTDAAKRLPGSRACSSRSPSSSSSSQ